MQQKSKLLNLRLIIACAILIICAIAITSKLISLSVSDGVFLQKEGKKRYIKYRETKAVRGSIYDRNNFPLAISIVNYDLYALSGFNSNKLLSLKNKIDIPSQSLDKKKFLKKTLLKKNISASEHLFIKNLNFNRLEVETRHSRHYPLGDQISPLIGFYGKDGPQEGIEKSYDYLLSGSDGREKLYKNAKIIHFAGGPKPWLVPICEANKYNAISEWWVYAKNTGLTKSFPYVRCYLLAPFRKLKSFTKNTFIGLIILKILNYFFPKRYSI